MTMHEVHVGPGEHISSACNRLARAAAEHGEAFCTFNDIRIEAKKGNSAAELEAWWDRDLRVAQAKYENSPEGIKARFDAEADLAAKQQKADQLVEKLSQLDWDSDIAVLDWLCKLQAPSDRIGVKFDRAAVIAEFAQHGYLPNVNCGDAFKADDRDNHFRWLVGQALDGLVMVGAIHGLIHKFADEWRAQHAVQS